MCGIIGFISNQNIQNLNIYKKNLINIIKNYLIRGPDFQDSINFKIRKIRNLFRI